MKYTGWPTYPKVNMFTAEHGNEDIHVAGYTLFRKKGDDGKWYLWPISYKAEGKSKDEAEFLRQAYSAIIANAHLVSLFGKIDTSIKGLEGDDIFLLDKSQESEEDRVRRLHPGAIT